MHSPIANLRALVDRHLNPLTTDHAKSLIETCNGSAAEALSIAYQNATFARDEKTRAYWDCVAIACQQYIGADNLIPFRGKPVHQAVLMGPLGEILRITTMDEEEIVAINELFRRMDNASRWARLALV